MSDISIKEALQHIDEAKEILKNKAIIKDGYYTNSNYVQLAANIAWDGVIIAMQCKMAKTGFKFPPRGKKNVDVYKNYIEKNDNTILNDFKNAYKLLYSYVGYYGDSNVVIMESGLDCAKNVITWCEKTTKQKQ